MADTGAPWNIPFAEPSDLVRDWPALSESVGTAVAAGLSAAAFNARSVITATDATWAVPALANPVVCVTAIGGGSGGHNSTIGTPAASGAGGTTTFDAGGGKTVSAAGGAALLGSTGVGQAGNAGWASNNGGHNGRQRGEVTTVNIANSNQGFGGAISVAYIDLTGVSTVNVTIGAGGAGATGGYADGGDGGRGEVIVEYVAG
jgi:hypothetical protein